MAAKKSRGTKGEGGAKLEHTVATKIEGDDGVAVIDSTDGFAIAGDDEGRQVLIVEAGLLAAIGFNGSAHGLKQAPVTENVSPPAALDD